MNTFCASCHQKQLLINKYLKLIKLLKTKCIKTSKSLLKSSSLQSETLIEATKDNIKSVISDFQGIVQKPNEKYCKHQDTQCKNNQVQLALLVIFNKQKKALLKHVFGKIKSAAKISFPQEQIPNYFPSIFLSFETDLKSIINDTLSYGKKIQSDKIQSSLIFRQLHLNNFDLQIKNKVFQKRIKKLESQITELQKRFLKQTQKKRQSLETVAQQIREKTQQIVQLQQIIKKYERMIGKSLNLLNTENVLIENEDDLKKTCLRLENVNQKLNDDIRNAQSNIKNLNDQINFLKQDNLKLKIENKSIREKNFDLSQEISKNDNIGEIYVNLCRKFNKKIQKLKLIQKQFNYKLKKAPLNQHFNIKQFSDITNSGDYNVISSKNTEVSEEVCSPISKKSSIKECQIEQKIEEIFSYLFNIEIEGYKLVNQEYFDDDEISLLKVHKNNYLSNLRKQKGQSNKVIKTQKLINTQNLNQTDQIFFIQSPHKREEINAGQNSFLNALQPPEVVNSPVVQIQKNQFTDNMKLIQLQIQKSKLIQKISDLKNLHLHIRNVILNFLKSVDLSNSKSQCQNILQVVFQFFEYSEDQKQNIFSQQKKKKVWGLF